MAQNLQRKQRREERDNKRERKRVMAKRNVYYPGKMTEQLLLPDVKAQNKNTCFIKTFGSENLRENKLKI